MKPNMNQKTLSIIHLAGDILSDPSHRCTGTLAVDKDNTPVWPEDPSACKWCLTGAMRLACFRVGASDSFEAMEVSLQLKELLHMQPKEAAYLRWDNAGKNEQDDIVKLMRGAT